MKRFCSLEILNKEIFDTDVYSDTSEKLFSKGEEITPEIILKLYFKNVYIKEEIKKEPFIEKIVEKFEDPIQSGIIFQKELFNEEQAKNIVLCAIKIGKLMEFSADELALLRDASYYNDIGEALSQKDENASECGLEFDYLHKIMNLPEAVAETPLKCREKYKPKDFFLNEGLSTNVPLHHIVSIATFYTKMLQKTSNKEETLRIMLQIGGNRFNIFVLHKFINAIRNENE